MKHAALSFGISLMDPVILRSVRVQKIVDSKCTTCKQRAASFRSKATFVAYCTNGSCNSCQDEEQILELNQRDIN